MAKWTFEPDEKFEDGHPKNAITNDRLIKWLDKYLPPDEWFPNISGGEPGLYPGIITLIPLLAARGYKGMVRTNGSLPIPESQNFKRVAAWHKDQRMPEYYDAILILENPEDNWAGKEKICKERNIPYAVFPYKFFATDHSQTTCYPPKPNRLFTHMCTMYSSGSLSTNGCMAGTGDHTKLSLHKMSEPPVFDLDLCRMCGNVGATEYFIFHMPGWADTYGIKDSMIKDFSYESMVFNPRTMYPLLTKDNKWVGENGEVLGVLGDDIDEINREYAKTHPDSFTAQSVWKVEEIKEGEDEE
ncbi:MAG: hypothetical protein LBU88_00365 [Treponema sp.]|nr:hypothetical protein [Treponema sp.]